MRSHLLPGSGARADRPPPLDYRPPHAPYIPLAFLDDETAVVDKPSGLLSVPGKTADLADCAEARLKALLPIAHTVHRLDMDTSGLLIFARTKAGQRALSGQFERREIEKTYHALVFGAPEADRGEVDLPLRADWPNRPRQMVCHEHGKPSRTIWEVEARRGETTLMRLTPVTGRSHQLRVHMASAGWPILGDPFYADGPARGAPRLMLHASRLVWRCPATGERRETASAPPFL